ncbi:MAG: helix-turn-helix transcriptional regulator [Planctomycetota bacterium]
MIAPSILPFVQMGTTGVRAIADLPGVCLLARDVTFRLLWCNAEYAHRCERPDTESMRNTTLRDILPLDRAVERETLMKRVQTKGHMVSYQQLWQGARWVTMVWPLDEEEFGQPGYFVMITLLGNTADGIPSSLWDSTLELVRTPHLGDELGKLSTRELEVFYWLATGLTQVEVAKLLHRSPKTIATHADHVYQKLGFNTRAELVRFAVERGIVHFSGEQWSELVDSR